MTDAMKHLRLEVMEEYERMIRSSKYKCHLSQKAFREIRKKWELLRNSHAVFTGYSEQKAVAEKNGVDLEKLIKRPLKDLYDLCREDCDDKEMSKLYTWCMEIAAWKESMKKAA